MSQQPQRFRTNPASQTDQPTTNYSNQTYYQYQHSSQQMPQMQQQQHSSQQISQIQQHSSQQMPQIKQQHPSQQMSQMQQQHSSQQLPQIQQQMPQIQHQRQNLNMSNSNQSNFNATSSQSQMHPPTGAVQQHSDDSKDVMKLIKLFRSFQGLCIKQNPAMHPKMTRLIEQTIQGNVIAKDFESGVSQMLGHNPTANLLGFLEKSLPILRNDIQAGKVTIENILNKPKQMSQESPSPQAFHGVNASPQSLPGPSPLQKPAQSPLQPPNSDPSQKNVPESPMNRPPASAPIFDQHGNQEHQQNQYQNMMDAGPFPPASGSQSQEQQQQVHYTPMKPIVPKIEPTSMVNIVKSEPNISMSSAEVVTTTNQPSTSMTSPQGSSVVTYEQQQQLGAPEVAYKEISNDAADKSIFDRQSFAARLHRKMPECAAFEENVLTMLSDFLEVKIRELVKSSVSAAEHRLEPLNQKAGLVAASDPKKQLQMIEKFERVEKQKREFLEREAILKMSKSKSKDADMVEKVKQLKKADQEELSNKQTNEAAIAALAGTKRQWPSKSTTSTTSIHRPRKKHITMRDLMYVFERDPVAKHSVIFRKMLYGLSSE